ncbi:hypothetical protein NE237_023617 [Protea cynaroides]|uniref:Serine aminopeptidase S33 domain-containing protein n=1 Tax=Protea cynaroides TaxID=273540 RepID=A0A9Q0K6Q5_9MAGN|nr:hypothetical protein NE237_023617 [Protea cynaroides]
MAHPIHEATENSPFGDLTREDFYKTHHVIHQQEFMLNRRNMEIFTQSWCPDATVTELKGLVAMVHGYVSESNWIFQLTAVAIAKLGFYVCALDMQGHGYSHGLYGHIPDIKPVIDDCIQFFDSVGADHPKLPAFLYGESLGVLNGAMFGVSSKFKPVLPLRKTPSVIFTKSLTMKSFKEEWKRKLVTKKLPLLVLHGEDDLICDSDSARLFYELAGSRDKTLKIFPGMWHQLIGEPKEDVELVFQTIFSWLQDQASMNN